MSLPRRRLFWFACVATLLAAPIVLYFVWTANSLRASLDHIEIGMNEEEARQVLASFPGEPDRWPDVNPIIGEVWSTRNGEARYVRWEPPFKVYLLIRDGNRPNQIVKTTNRGIAYVDLEEGRVVGKTWLEYPRPSLLEWFKSKLR